MDIKRISATNDNIILGGGLMKWMSGVRTQSDSVTWTRIFATYEQVLVAEGHHDVD